MVVSVRRQASGSWVLGMQQILQNGLAVVTSYKWKESIPREQRTKFEPTAGISLTTEIPWSLRWWAGPIPLKNAVRLRHTSCENDRPEHQDMRRPKRSRAKEHFALSLDTAPLGRGTWFEVNSFHYETFTRDGLSPELDSFSVSDDVKTRWSLHYKV